MLLILALPVQSFASAAMLGCMMPPTDAMQPVAMTDDMMADCHASSDQPGTPSTSHNCNHCAACALASSLPIPAAGSTPVVPVAVCFVAQPAAAFSGFIPDGPERPPRPFLA